MEEGGVNLSQGFTGTKAGKGGGTDNPLPQISGRGGGGVIG